MKVNFRVVKAGDLKRLNEIVNDKSVAKYINVIPPLKLKSTRDFYLKCKKSKIRWYCITVDGIIAGSFHLAPRSRDAKQAHVGEFGISIAREYWGMHLGCMAIEFMLKDARKLKLKRIEFEAVADNKRAVKLYKKHGFIVEGRKKRSFKIGDEYHDTLVMARLI